MRLAISISLLCIVLSSYASGLPPEHESARLLLVIEEAVTEENWSLADSSLSQMADLQTELPVPFFFYNGWVHFKQGRFEKAQRSLEHYVVKVGPSGSFYYDALRLLTSVEEKITKGSNESSNDAASVNLDGSQNAHSEEPLLVNKERDAYVQSLKALFLTDEPVAALEMQINSLMSAHPYTGSRLKKISEKQGLKYQISVQDSGVILQEKNYEGGFPQLSAKRLEVSGVDPFIRFACSSKEIACWLYHPSDLHVRWIVVDNDELVASELSMAFTRLIQLLQKK